MRLIGRKAVSAPDRFCPVPERTKADERQAKPGRGGRDSKLKPFEGILRVPIPPGQGWPPAGSESCVARGRPRLRSVDSERAGRATEPRKMQTWRPTVCPLWKATLPTPQLAWRRKLHRGLFRARHARIRIPQEPGRPDRLHPTVPAGDRVNNLQAPGRRAICLAGTKHWAQGGTAKRRQRSAAGRTVGSRSLS